MRPRTLACIAVLGAASLALAGSLTPPAGPVAPTPGPEPRIAINATNTPGDADSVYKISSPGSYYLTGSVNGATGKHGIEIASSNVTIDLMGYELVGKAAALTGVTTTVIDLGNIEIRNGSVRGWGGDGVSLMSDGFSTCAITNIRAVGNSGTGIAANLAATITGCTVSGNESNGISAGADSTVTGCTAYHNGNDGISASNGCTITHCTSTLSGGRGIVASVGVTITGCTALSNTGDGIVGGGDATITGCTASFNAGHGIHVGIGTIFGCTSNSNNGDGILVSNDCAVISNACYDNGRVGDGAGIHATSPDNRIEGNMCTDNDRGIDVDFAGSIILRNTCSGNTSNWEVVAGNVILVVNATTAAAVSGNSGGVSPGSTNPNANFSY